MATTLKAGCASVAEELVVLRDVLQRINTLLDEADWLDTDRHGDLLLAIQSIVLGAIYGEK